MKIIVLPGDGIGPETMAATVEVLRAASQRFGFELALEHDIAGHDSLRRHGATVTPALLDKVRAADGLMLGPMATFDFKDESKGEINPSMFFRKELDLYANIRPSRTWQGVPHKVDAFDLVVVRENTEGFYADRNIASGGSEMLITEDVVVSLRRITRLCCARIARAAFELASARRKHVSIVHKANVLKIGDGMFIDECHKVARDFPDVTVDDFIVDAMMAHVVRAPQRFDVIVTTNMFGDILSDLTAELSGSLGLGGSLNMGARYAMGQAAHGSAPDIAGQDIANPFSLILSAGQLLDWHGRRTNQPAYVAAADAIARTAAIVVEAGESTRDVGGNLGTAATGRAFAQRLLEA
ncbi:isocitrate/isopropylmalate family dehydrogenase [Pigmentiphaga sp.]|uniref:isocitrate/isopropylmalate dehydrogenase family protein n=1 Tax=Pigmentiphaga sp. TaxID=1977564 RepID=UPI00128E8A26|nr:isocitrate/isopropylmalate family dehydrogenase [Pigmentiphaga sp.]MPS26345.1 isocitrate/isopropylmalate dehydrogenase family protein [Alcaligenaceae bacterium SAGV5]MPS53398.1 isocitrate/isopropylmalate dehydrogenase family protein [Alcaligenaceae bacterium SAGV3]MPT56394.1 isocitrate/isopropylmalate dehydrogenase family protein [Alcaligenaceae bacterium]